jgi:regulator of protease activity HflC (stomatin/prohibitin superfamily)
MFGINFIKVQPTEYVMLYKNGKLTREGAGLSFFYFGPASSIVLIPLASMDVPFIFNEVTSDFQEVTIQGQITYRVIDPKKLSQLMNFTLTSNGKEYTSDDPEKLSQRLINHVQVLTRSSLKGMTLRLALGISAELITFLREGMEKADETTSLGIKILGFSILAVKPTPETARALEAEAREQILLEADSAIYLRRNAAVEQERIIKENELNTEIAVENKKRQIRETQMDAEKAVQQKKRELSEAEMAAKISLEEKNKMLVTLAADNARLEADAKAYGISAIMESFARSDPKVIQALASVGMNPGQLVAAAFKELAENADKIGELNISPDLLRELMFKGSTK